MRYFQEQIVHLVNQNEKEKTKSPIKEPSLRRPGQSLDEEIDKLINDRLMFYLITAFALIFAAYLEWDRHLNERPPSPWVFTIMSICYGLFVSYKFYKLYPRLRAMKLGRAGEIAVGQLLEEKLRPLGYNIFHDVIGNEFNLDHVAVGQNGIFVIETKTHKKPAEGNPRVKYDGHHITVNGFVPKRDPIEQVKAQASWLSNILRESTSKSFRVQPIVTYPGWWVEEMPMNVDIWVLNEKAIPAFISKQKKQLSEEQISMITFHLKRYIIAKEAEKT